MDFWFSLSDWLAGPPSGWLVWSSSEKLKTQSQTSLSLHEALTVCLLPLIGYVDPSKVKGEGPALYHWIHLKYAGLLSAFEFRFLILLSPCAESSCPYALLYMQTPSYLVIFFACYCLLHETLPVFFAIIYLYFILLPFMQTLSWRIILLFIWIFYLFTL